MPVQLKKKKRNMGKRKKGNENKKLRIEN